MVSVGFFFSQSISVFIVACSPDSSLSLLSPFLSLLRSVLTSCDPICQVLLLFYELSESFSKKPVLPCRSWSVSPGVLKFQVLKSLMHFESIFLPSSDGNLVLFYMCRSMLPSTISWKDCFFPPSIYIFFLSKIRWLKLVHHWLFSISLVCALCLCQHHVDFVIMSL